jgi:5,10-methenyltetrahydrofolate synthetase
MARDAAVRTGKLGPRTVAAFWPLADEPDLRPLLEQWVQMGVAVALPVIRQRATPLEFRTWTPAATLQPGICGVLEPREGAVVLPDVILVPTLGYTDRGDRLGYGGGYYDRTLADLQTRGHTFTAIGIAWSCGKLGPAYQPAPHDIRLDAILTPEGWIPQAL